MKRGIIIALACLAAPAVQAEEFSGIARAVDGDSMTVAGRRVRLFGIDAPEYRQTCRIGWSNWACGSDAATALRTMVDGRQLDCSAVDRDVYGRTVAQCRVGGIDLGAVMIDKGFAIALDNAPQSYLARQATSRSSSAGIWASQFETPATYRAANPRADTAPPAQVQSRAPARFVAATRVVRGAFRNCAEARAAGAAPVHAGQPGFGPHLDRDGDGIGCEPYRGR
jgi:endonuclease YncB( thermonuclease family)